MLIIIIINQWLYEICPTSLIKDIAILDATNEQRHDLKFLNYNAHYLSGDYPIFEDSKILLTRTPKVDTILNNCTSI